MQLWRREKRTVVFVTHSIAEAVYPVDAHRRDVAAAGADPEVDHVAIARRAARSACAIRPSSSPSRTSCAKRSPVGQAMNRWLTSFAGACWPGRHRAGRACRRPLVSRRRVPERAGCDRARAGAARPAGQRRRAGRRHLVDGAPGAAGAAPGGDRPVATALVDWPLDSPRNLLYHAAVTAQSTLVGFVLGTLARRRAGRPRSSTRARSTARCCRGSSPRRRCRCWRSRRSSS